MEDKKNTLLVRNQNGSVNNLDTERYKELFDTLPIGIYGSTPEGHIIMSNATLIKMLGYNSAEELSECSAANCIYKNKLSRSAFIEQINKDDEVIGFESIWIKKNKEEIWVRENARIIRDDKNKIQYYEGTVENITAQKKAEEALLKSENQLRELNITKDKFFSVIAHDLRSPFQGLLGMASILVDDEYELSSSEKSDFTKKLYEGLKTQFALLDNLLTWSRLQRGVIEFIPSLNDISCDIAEACAILNSSLEKKNISLVTNLPNSMFAVYDKNMVATILRNLLSNAIKFTPNNGIITISAVETDKDYLITVQDTGIGIQEENISKLFRIDSLFSMRGTNDEGGTGLGLILCKEFVEKHSGKIWVESQFGKGSTLHFTIPKVDKAI
jgi:PAS domain S-box-containing protein